MRLLDRYRLSFTEAYEGVVGTIRNGLVLKPTGRAAKSTTSISEKLRRESIRLTQIQDIAGCRLIASDIVEQDRVVEALMQIFEKAAVVDRREKPSHGYRAVHVIATFENRAVEIQVRTALQQLWAEYSEKLSDLIDPAIKYGGGDQEMRDALEGMSKVVARVESLQLSAAELLQMSSLDRFPDTLRNQITTHEEEIRAINQALSGDLQDLIDRLPKRKEEK